MRKWAQRPGFGSDYEIDLWCSDAKLKAKLHDQQMSNGLRKRRPSTKPNEQHQQPLPSTSLNRLRERTREERSHCSSLSNRMEYMREELRRKRQLVQQARGRYQRVLQVRSRSVAEKKQLAQERQSLLRKQQESVSMKASRIRLDRKNSSMTHSQWQNRNQQSAGQVKHSRQNNQKLIDQQLHQQAEKKKRLVERGHQQTEASREKMKELARKREEAGKREHDQKLLREYARAEMQQRKKGKLLAIFQEKAKKFQEEKQHRSQQLLEYQILLGKCFKLAKSKSKDSFYLTH